MDDETFYDVLVKDAYESLMCAFLVRDQLDNINLAPQRVDT